MLVVGGVSLRIVVISFALIIGIVAVLYFSSRSDVGPSETTQELSDFIVGPKLNLSNTSDGSSDPEIAAFGNNVYVVWSERTSASYEIFFRVSRDNGVTFETPINISENIGHSVDPTISADESSIRVSWRDNWNSNSYRLLSRSSQDGIAFSSVTVGPETQNAGYDITFSGDIVYEVLSRMDDRGSSDLFFRRGDIRGQTSEEYRQISRHPGFTRATSPSISAQGDNLYVVWQQWTYLYLDIPPETIRTQNLVFIRSTDQGETFSEPLLLTDYEGIETNFARPELASSENHVYVVWFEYQSPNNYQIFLRASSDDGERFSDRMVLSDSSSFAPVLEAGPGENVYVAWSSNVADSSGEDPFFIGPKNLLFRGSVDGGATFTDIIVLGDPSQVSEWKRMAVWNDRVYLLWTEGPPRIGKVAVNTEILFRVIEAGP